LSCNYFETKKRSSQEIADEELKSINWNDVDKYPSFAICDDFTDKIKRKQCFETTVLRHVNDYLSKQHIVVSQDVSDTIKIKLQVDKKGRIEPLSIKVAAVTRENIPEIDSLLKASISSLPKIYPAIKRNQQVTTEFILPVVVSIQ